MPLRLRAIALLHAALLTLAPDAARANPKEEKRREFGIVPLVGGDTDVGFGVGQLSTFSRLAAGVAPYVWSLESAAFISFEGSAPTRPVSPASACARRKS